MSAADQTGWNVEVEWMDNGDVLYSKKYISVQYQRDNNNACNK